MTTLFSPSELSFTSVPLSSASSSSPSLRADGRAPLAYRELTLDLSVVPGCVGSARAQIGDSQGASEVWAGVRAEVEDVGRGEGEPDGGRGRIVLSLDCTAPCLASLRPELPTHLHALLSSLFSASTLPPALLSSLVVLPSSKCWVLYLDILILSSSAGNIPDLALIAARSALANTRLPLTESIGYDDAEDAPEGAVGEAGGFSGLVRAGKAGKKAVDWELIEGGWGEGKRLAEWEQLPVGISLNLIEQLPHLDPTLLEEAAASSLLMTGFTTKGDLCALSQLGEGEIEAGRVSGLVEEAKRVALELGRALNAKLR